MYAGIAIVPLLVLAFSLTARLTSAERVRELGDRVADLLPAELGAPDALARLVEAGVGLSPVQMLLALLPMFFASNYFYAYQGAVNANLFDGPTRALNATLESAGSIVGALMIGYGVLDLPWMHRRTRGYIGLGVVAALVITVWAVGLSWQVTFTRESVKASGHLINYHDSNYKGKGALYFFCE